MSAQTPLHSAPASQHRHAPGQLPPQLEHAVWRGADLSRQPGTVLSSGFPALDAELPGGGWPCEALTEILAPQPSVCEWRLVGGALGEVVAASGQIVIVGPPKIPHLPGLHHCGIDEAHLAWIQAQTPAERLWCTEQLVRSGACGAVLAWLPQARPEHIRRLQVCARASRGPVFIFRPASARHEASAAPLRLLVDISPQWELQVQLLKRRGPTHHDILRLPSIPGGLDTVLTPRLQALSRIIGARCAGRDPVHELSAHALGSTPASPRSERRAFQ